MEIQCLNDVSELVREWMTGRISKIGQSEDGGRLIWIIEELSTPSDWEIQIWIRKGFVSALLNAKNSINVRRKHRLESLRQSQTQEVLLLYLNRNYEGTGLGNLSCRLYCFFYFVASVKIRFRRLAMEPAKLEFLILVFLLRCLFC